MKSVWKIILVYAFISIYQSKTLFIHLLLSSIKIFFMVLSPRIVKGTPFRICIADGLLLSSLSKLLIFEFLFWVSCLSFYSCSCLSSFSKKNQKISKELFEVVIWKVISCSPLSFFSSFPPPSTVTALIPFSCMPYMHIAQHTPWNSTWSLIVILFPLPLMNSPG